MYIFKKLEKFRHFVIPTILVACAFCSLWYKIGEYPLVDYDEATYASVIHDTLASGDFITLQKSNGAWFEKPPLFFWMGMLSVSVFGETESAMRLPSVLFGVVVLLLTYLIAFRLTKSVYIATLSFFIILFTPALYSYSREVRLDSGALAAILATLYAMILGWEKKHYLLYIFPAIAFGFLIKNVVVFLAVPLMIIISFSFRNWRWVRHTYVWIGCVMGIVILTPWHYIQHMRYGQKFWDSYVGYHVLGRAFDGIGRLAEQPADHLFYFKALWHYGQPVTILFLLALCFYLFFVARRVDKNIRRTVHACLISIAVILIIFQLARTHIITYILPIYPFVAIVIGIVLYYATLKRIVIFAPTSLVLIGLMIFNNNFSQHTVFSYHYEERDAARAYYANSMGNSPLYVVAWPFQESIPYYAKTRPIFVEFPRESAFVIPASSYVLMNRVYLDYFFDESGRPAAQYKDMRVFYPGESIFLIHTEHPFELSSDFQ